MSRAYGWSPDGRVLPDEAAIIREAADWVLDGNPAAGFVRTLIERGVPTAAGKSWSVPTLARVLKNPRLIAMRSGPGGEGLVPNPAVEPILDRDTWERLSAMFGDESRKKFRPKAKRESLLSGLLECAVCNGPLHWSSVGYKCNDCGRVTIRQSIIEPEIAESVLAVLTTDAWRAALTDASRDVDHYRRLVDESQAKLVHLAEVFGGPEGNRAAFDAGVAAARRTKSRAEAALSTAQVSYGLPDLTDAELIAWWEKATVAQRRAVVRLLIEKIVVSPKSEPRERLAVTWRTPTA